MNHIGKAVLNVVINLVLIWLCALLLVIGLAVVGLPAGGVEIIILTVLVTAAMLWVVWRGVRKLRQQP